MPKKPNFLGGEQNYNKSTGEYEPNLVGPNGKVVTDADGDGISHEKSKDKELISKYKGEHGSHRGWTDIDKESPESKNGLVLSYDSKEKALQAKAELEKDGVKVVEVAEEYTKPGDKTPKYVVYTEDESRSKEHDFNDPSERESLKAEEKEFDTKHGDVKNAPYIVNADDEKFGFDTEREADAFIERNKYSFDKINKANAKDNKLSDKKTYDDFGFTTEDSIFDAYNKGEIDLRQRNDFLNERQSRLSRLMREDPINEFKNKQEYADYLEAQEKSQKGIDKKSSRVPWSDKYSDDPTEWYFESYKDIEERILNGEIPVEFKDGEIDTEKLYEQIKGEYSDQLEDGTLEDMVYDATMDIDEKSYNKERKYRQNKDVAQKPASDTFSKDLKSSYNHFVSDLGREPTVDDIAEDLLDNYSAYKDVDVGGPEAYRSWYNAVQEEFNRQGYGKQQSERDKAIEQIRTITDRVNSYDADSIEGYLTNDEAKLIKDLAQKHKLTADDLKKIGGRTFADYGYGTDEFAYKEERPEFLSKEHLDQLYEQAGGDEDEITDLIRASKEYKTSEMTNSDLQGVVEAYMEKKTGKSLLERYDEKLAKQPLSLKELSKQQKGQDRASYGKMEDLDAILDRYEEILSKGGQLSPKEEETYRKIEQRMANMRKYRG